MKNLKKLSREGLKELNSLKNKEIKDLSKVRGAIQGIYPSYTERQEGNCVITDVVHYDDNGSEYFRKDIVSVCG